MEVYQMHRRFKLTFRTQRGAAAVEYALLLALIAVVCIVVFTSIGSTPESSSNRSSVAPRNEIAPTSPTNSLDTISNPTNTATNNNSNTGQEPPQLECPEVYQAKALASLKQAELLYKYGNQEGKADHLLNQTKTYLAFAQYAESRRTDCQTAG